MAKFSESLAFWHEIGASFGLYVKMTQTSVIGLYQNESDRCTVTVEDFMIFFNRPIQFGLKASLSLSSLHVRHALSPLFFVSHSRKNILTKMVSTSSNGIGLYSKVEL